MKKKAVPKPSDMTLALMFQPMIRAMIREEERKRPKTEIELLEAIFGKERVAQAMKESES